MKIELHHDGTCFLYNEVGNLVGHFAHPDNAKAWAKLTFGKEVQLHHEKKAEPHSPPHHSGPHLGAHKK